jgi:hypothetical protein
METINKGNLINESAEDLNRAILSAIMNDKLEIFDELERSIKELGEKVDWNKALREAIWINKEGSFLQAYRANKNI